MNRLSKEKKDQLVLTGLLTLIAVVGLIYGLMGFQRQKLKDTDVKIVEQQEKLDEANRVLKLRAAIAKNLEDVRAELAQIEQQMAPPINHLAWIRDTMRQFQSTHPEVQITNYDSPYNGEIGVLPSFPYKAVICPIQGVSNYHNLGSFLADYENTYPYSLVRGLILEPVDGSGETGNENLRFRMNFVALIKPKPLASL